MGRPSAHERGEGVRRNREVPPLWVVRRGHAAETWFPPRERAKGERRSFREVLDRQQALEDPVVETRLTKLIAVQDWVHAFPPFLEEVQQRRVRGALVEALERVEDAGGPV